MLRGELPEGWDGELPRFTTDGGAMATRKASGIAINAIAGALPELVGGSADLAESNLTDIKGEAFFEPGKSGRNIHFGVREHAMGAALNGMALHGGLRPFGGTFLIFSDYMRPAVRLAALMRTSSIFVFTHDSIGLGEDGPTHQPVEHLASLRAMPGLVVLRPGDAAETVEAWRFIAAHRDGPVALCLTRQTLPLGSGGARPAVERGAYVVREAAGWPRVLLLATGSEVHLAVGAAEMLEAEGTPALVVSMPSWELFERQDPAYRDSVLPPGVTARVSVEAGSTLGWSRWVGDRGTAIGLDRFGASAPGDVAIRNFGFTAARVADAARGLLAAAGSPGQSKEPPG
jgi:transketolase